MLMTELKVAMAVVLMVAILTGGAGLIYQKTQASVQPKAQGATERGKQQDARATKPTETAAEKVMLAYVYNDAKGDEKFLGHTLRVSGRVERVQRVEIGNKPYYLLTLDDADRPHNNMPLSFVFRTDSQKQLTKLEMGQRVRIEGVCQGRTAKGRDAMQSGGAVIDNLSSPEREPPRHPYHHSGSRQMHHHAEQVNGEMLVRPVRVGVRPPEHGV
jgi:hypothetical protein